MTLLEQYSEKEELGKIKDRIQLIRKTKPEDIFNNAPILNVTPEFSL